MNWIDWVLNFFFHSLEFNKLLWLNKFQLYWTDPLILQSLPQLPTHPSTLRGNRGLFMISTKELSIWVLVLTTVLSTTLTICTDSMKPKFRMKQWLVFAIFDLSFCHDRHFQAPVRSHCISHLLCCFFGLTQWNEWDFIWLKQNSLSLFLT